MQLIDKEGNVGIDAWQCANSGDPLVCSEHSLVPLERWQEYVDAFGVAPRGVQVVGEQAIEPLVPLLPQLSLIVIEFPKSRDGRGFTLARMLRERYAFAGDIRAVGPLLPDQFHMLLDCGYSSLLAPATVPVIRWRDAAQARGAAAAKPRTLLERLALNRSQS